MSFIYNLSPARYSASGNIHFMHVEHGIISVHSDKKLLGYIYTDETVEPVRYAMHLQSDKDNVYFIKRLPSSLDDISLLQSFGEKITTKEIRKYIWTFEYDFIKLMKF